jgi:hypothetical protein
MCDLTAERRRRILCKPSHTFHGLEGPENFRAIHGSHAHPDRGHFRQSYLHCCGARLGQRRMNSFLVFIPYANQILSVNPAIKGPPNYYMI